MTNPIPDQTATAGTAFSYQFPANTFNDTDTGDTLSYTATKADDTTLPTWLAFTDSTRTFAGTPVVADTGTVSVKVTASDGNGGSISDEFDITVRAATTTPTAAASLVSNLGQTQHSGSLPLNSWDVVQGFETGASGYTLVSVDLRLNRQSGGTSIAVPSVKLMEGTKTATSVTLTGQPVTLTAEVAQVTSTTGENYTFTAPSGTTLSASTRYFLVVERVGTRVQWMTTASTGEDAPPASAAGWSIDDERWRRSASDTANFTGKVARSQLLRVNGNTNTSTNAAPTVPNAIPDQTATAGTAFSYAFPDSTFNDTDTGDTLSYTATKADGMTLPTWLVFTDSARTFAGTPVVADTGTVSVKVKVTASDGNERGRSATGDQRRLRYHGHHQLPHRQGPASATVPGRPDQPLGNGQRGHHDRPLLDRAGRQRRLRRHRLQDRSLAQWHLELDQPRRRHRHRARAQPCLQHHLRPHRAGRRHHPPLPRLGHQQHRHQHSLRRRQCHHRHQHSPTTTGTPPR